MTVRGSLVLLPIADLTFDPTLQCRTSVYVEEIVNDYKESMTAGDVFPPLLVVRVAGDAEDVLFVVDGFQRGEAADRAGCTDIECDVIDGTRDDAVREAAGANAKHGLTRTREEKGRAVRMLLRHPTYCQLTQREIAAMAGVTHTTVGNVQREYGLSPGQQLTNQMPAKLVEQEKAKAEAAAKDEKAQPKDAKDPGDRTRSTDDEDVKAADDKKAKEREAADAVDETKNTWDRCPDPDCSGRVRPILHGTCDACDQTPSRARSSMQSSLTVSSRLLARDGFGVVVDGILVERRAIRFLGALRTEVEANAAWLKKIPGELRTELLAVVAVEFPGMVGEAFDA